MVGDLIIRRMRYQQIGDICLIDAVEASVKGARHVTLFFSERVAADRVKGPSGSECLRYGSIANSSFLTFVLRDEDAPLFSFDGRLVHVVTAKAELQTFKDLNTIVAVRNGESAANVLDWLAYHITHHALDGTVILNRARPGDNPLFYKELEAGFHKRDLDCQVAIIESEIPLGVAGLPAESHPFCAAHAPGKSRMALPPADSWASPLATLNWFEIAKARFLRNARAVANIEVHDLIVPGDQAIFDKVMDAPSGVLNLVGQHCYPWRIRNEKNLSFGDHICVQFDAIHGLQRWCVAPDRTTDDATWRLRRVNNTSLDPAENHVFYRHMALRHRTANVANIIPKASLIEDRFLCAQAKDYFEHKPIRMPKVKARPTPGGRGRCAIVTTMKNEGPFILEWLAYHRAIGFSDILVYTNDCTDGTDTMLDLLMRKGIVTHRQNGFRDLNLRPQQAALKDAAAETIIQEAKWVTCIDVDEYINIKVGDGTLDALLAAVPDANLISMTWRLFGNSDVHTFCDRPITEQFKRCAREVTRKPHQAWGFKTMFVNNGTFRKLGVHRPKGLNAQLWEGIVWVNGSGKTMPSSVLRNGWRSTTDTYGYDLVQLNHYAVRSTESFLVKRDRGRVNHVDRDQGTAYWFRMNNNFEVDDSISKNLPRMYAELEKLRADPEIAAAHDAAVAAHRAKISALRAKPDYAAFFESLTSARMQKLSRLHHHFGANVFLSGPEVIPDDVAERDPAGEWFFTIETTGDTKH